ncbi:hypothetical protein [Kaistia soli]|nr:hypothetical protein [Kaistia soli]
MARKRHKPEEIAATPRQVDVLTGQGKPIVEAGQDQAKQPRRKCRI